MSRSAKNLSVPAAIAVIAIGVIALISSGALSPAPVTGRNPSLPPVASPSTPPVPATPKPPPTPEPPATHEPPATPAPTPRPVDDLPGGEKSVELDVADPHRVQVDVKDFTGSLVDATSGRAGDGMSVRWYDLKVENLDEDTLRLSWVGLPNDDPVKLIVAHVDGNSDGKPSIVLFSLLPPPDSDAQGFDRVLDLHFEGPVTADDFDVAIQDGWDT